jgi:hypothetical protein
MSLLVSYFLSLFKLIENLTTKDTKAIIELFKVQLF